jgi:hypothetical protein
MARISIMQALNRHVEHSRKRGVNKIWLGYFALTAATIEGGDGTGAGA